MDVTKFIYDHLEQISNGKTVDYSLLTEEEQKSLYNISESHNIHLLTYETFKKSDMTSFNKTLLEAWKSKYVLRVLKHKKKCLFVKKIILLLNELGLNYQVLKGINYARYYQNPDARVMGDLDLLVEGSDLDDTLSLLYDLGYQKHHSEIGITKHVVLKKKGELLIEVHHATVDDSLYPELSNFTNLLLKKTREVEYEDIVIKVPEVEYDMIYCMVHMYTHLTGAGFGFRQFIDLYNIVKNHHINWEIVFEKSVEYKIYNFAISMLYMINEVGGISLPEMVREKLGDVDVESVELLKNDIFLSGDFGTSDKTKYLSSHIADYSKDDSKSLFVRSLLFLFPDKTFLLKRSEFNYLTKSSLLLPIAWIHRIGRNLKKGNISFDKKSINRELIKKRTRLIRWIEAK